MSAPHAAVRAVAADGGASKTDVWVVGDDGELLGQARGPGSNHQLLGIEGAVDALGSTIDQALGSAGLAAVGTPLPLGVYCLAGVDFDVDEQKLGEAIGARGWTATSVVRNDTMAVLRAGAESGWGVAVVCGSGLNCVGLGPTGEVQRFPSLAELSGDFTPGGAWLGVRALGLALRSRDGRGAPTVLAETVPAHLDRPDPESVLLGVYLGEIPYGKLFELARVCMDAAAGGDAVAVHAVAQLADEAALMATAMIGRLGLEQRRPEVVLGGGLFTASYGGFAAHVERTVSAAAPGARFRYLDAPPVLGSALLGLDALGAPPSAHARLRTQAGRVVPTDPG
ncbi:MAG TPA: BadF/BadG/BcrA/BcrD ATPase family protein [Acidimicrobiales bacterium]|nr:BadF/BadG/BcrA/BcrD ATPase family protein [Acidimicrobiales bacterium]